METLTFTCKIITPLFMAGADGKTPELRAPSIKGAMRYWWRALHGHLSLDSKAKRDQEKNDQLVNTGLRDREAIIFGGTGGDLTESRSSFSIQLINPRLETNIRKLVPHKERGYTGNAYSEGQTFEVKFRLPGNNEQSWEVKAPINGKQMVIFDRERLIALFHLTCILGGFGRRVRRGMGSVYIERLNASNSQQELMISPNPELSEIHRLISLFSPHYSIQGSRIQNIYSGSMAKYPWIISVEIGKADPELVLKISHTTHELHKENGYEPSLGHASRGRFASPVYVSVSSDMRPVITTLNTVPDRDAHNISLNLQNEFKRKLL